MALVMLAPFGNCLLLLLVALLVYCFQVGLVDSDGAVKLADFGVSACMFDTGDRLRSRNTFVGNLEFLAAIVFHRPSLFY